MGPLMAAQLAMSGIQMVSGFIQARKRKKEMQKAERAAKKAISAARQRLQVNPFAALSVNTQPYETQRENVLQSVANVQEAAREGEQRGVGAVAGKVLAAQQKQEQTISDALSTEMSNLKKLTAEEEKNLRDQNVEIDLAQAEGAQQAAAQAREERAAALQSGIQGLTSAATFGIAQAAPLYKGGAGEGGKLSQDQLNMLFQQFGGGTSPGGFVQDSPS